MPADRRTGGLFGRRPASLLCIWLGALAPVLPAAAAAQVRATLVDSASGTAIPGAVIEAWSPVGRTGSGQADALGRVILSARDTSSALVLFVRAVGFRPLRLSMRAHALPDTIRLARAAVWLPSLSTSSGGKLCPVADDPSARALLAAVARHYDKARNLEPVRAAAHLREGYATDAEVGEWSPDPTSSAYVAGNGEMFEVWRDRIIPRLGYGIPTGGHPSLDGQYNAWTYPQFEMGYAYHFFEPLFDERHSLAYGGGENGMTELVFCPLSKKQAEVEGTLVISDDSGLARATWHFVVPRDDERAGGEATFAPLRPAAPPGLLMTVRSEFWRHTSRGRWYQRAWTFGDWSGDSAEARRAASRRIQR